MKFHKVGAVALLFAFAGCAAVGEEASAAAVDRGQALETDPDQNWLFGRAEKDALDRAYVGLFGTVPSKLSGSPAKLKSNWQRVLIDLPSWEASQFADKLVALEQGNVSLTAVDAWLGSFPNMQAVIARLAGTGLRGLDVPLEIINDQVVSRDGEVASGGVALPVGAVRDTSCLRLYKIAADGSATAVPAQFHTLGMAHRDGSLNWVLAQTVIGDTSAVDLPAAARPTNGLGNPYYYNVTPNHLREDGVNTLLTPRSLQYRLRTAIGTCSKNVPVSATPVSVARLAASGEVQINTGPMQAAFSIKAFQLPNRLTVDGRVIINGSTQTFASRRNTLPEPLRSCLVQSGTDEPSLGNYGFGTDLNTATLNATACRGMSSTPVQSDNNYASLFGNNVQATIEESGPVRAVVRFERVSRPDGSPLQPGDLGYVIRVFASAGSRVLRIEYTAVSRDSLSIRTGVGRVPSPAAIPATRTISQWELGWTAELGEPATSVKYGLLDMGSAPITQIGDTVVANADPNQDSILEQLIPNYADSVPLRRMRTQLTSKAPSTGTVTASTTRDISYASGWVQVAGKGASLTLATRNFWQQFPKSLEYKSNRQIKLDLWPANAPFAQVLAGGRAKTYEFGLGANMNPQQVSAAVRAPLRLTPTPEYASRVETEYPFVPETDSAFPTQARVLRSTHYSQTLPGLLLGDSDFGDVAGDGANPAYTETERRTTYLRNTYDVQSQTGVAPFNNYRAAGLAPLLYARQARETHAFRIGESMVLHSLDRDIGNYAPNEVARPGYPLTNWPIGGRELVNGRPRDHLSLAQQPANIYQWYQDLTYYYLMTGSRRIVDLLGSAIAGPQLRMMADGRIGNAPVDVAGRHFTLFQSQLLSVWRILGSEANTSLYEPGAYPSVVPSRNDTCGASTPAGEIVPNTACTAAQAQELFSKMQGTMLSLEGNVDWGVTDVDANYVRTPALRGARHELSGFTTTYAPEMFFKYYALTGSEVARRGVTRSADYFFNMFMMPTGGMRYRRGPGTYTDATGALAWRREDDMLAVGQMFSPGPLAFMASGNARYADLSRPVADWFYHYIKDGARGAHEIYAPAILNMSRALGRTHTDFSVPTGNPQLTAAYNDRINALQQQVTSGVPYSSGPYGYESGLAANASGVWITPTTGAPYAQRGPYGTWGVTFSRCHGALEAMRGLINQGDLARARQWNITAGPHVGATRLTDLPGCGGNGGEPEGETFREMRRQLGL